MCHGAVLELTHVAYPPDVVPEPVRFGIRPVQFLVGDFLAKLDGLQHGAVAKAAAAHVVSLAASRVPVDSVAGCDEVDAVG